MSYMISLLNAAAFAFCRCFVAEPVVTQMAVIVAYLDDRRR